MPSFYTRQNKTIQKLNSDEHGLNTMCLETIEIMYSFVYISVFDLKYI